eukprot:TRINITY_DN7454_c0_g1_i1.p1 TRINITY_DN7454_c0_g1~~TRINITY_DN7454_c0_g1_i1.p1  ORF type:complete len:489 (-),score=76.39 TRINITY_DN7454_c0_g1_i1:21-1487(-)
MSDRKRKWDVPANSQAPKATASYAAGSSANPQLAAQLAQSKLNAILASTGTVSKFNREVVINDCTSDVRFLLCKTATQDEIARESDSRIKLLGRYIPPGTAGADKPLTLLVTADNEPNLNAAIAKINRLMGVASSSAPYQATAAPTRPGAPTSPYGAPNSYSARPPAYAPPPSYASPPSYAPSYAPPTSMLTCKTLVGMELETDPAFGLIHQLQGQNGSFLKHISDTTGSNVELRGRGTGVYQNEPMHFFISTNNGQINLDRAVGLCENLLAHVRQEYWNYSQAKNAYPQPNPNPHLTAEYAYPPPPPAPSNPYQADPLISIPYFSGPPTSASPSGNETATNRSFQEQKTRKFEERKPPVPQTNHSAYSHVYNPHEAVSSGEAPRKPKVIVKEVVIEGNGLSAKRKSLDPKESPKKTTAGLVDYGEDEESSKGTETEENAKKQKTGGTPFWAASSAIDESESNPLRQREKSQKQLEQLEGDVYNEFFT